MNNLMTSQRLCSPTTFVAFALCLAASALGLISTTTARAAAAVASNEAEVRGAVEQAFRQLRAGEYDALYAALPGASQRRVSRARFVGALERTRGLYELDRVEISAAHVAGDLAAVDSVVYGRGRGAFAGDAKIVARQYLVREGGRWRVTTGDRQTIAPLLAANPAFAKKYPLSQPRLYLKRDGHWVDASAMFRGMGSRALN